MLADAAKQLGIALHVQTPGPADPAIPAAASVVQAGLRDMPATRELAQRCDAITFENEWIDIQGLEPLAMEGVMFTPSLQALAPLVCKRSQRQLLQRLQI